MKFLLDTNICIYIIKKKPLQVLERFAQHRVGDIGISSVTLSELVHGVAKSARPEQNHRALEAFIVPLLIAPYDEAAAFHYGEIRADLERAGTPIGAMDLMIAAHARSLGLVLVSNNLREFERVQGLRLENWI